MECAGCAAGSDVGHSCPPSPEDVARVMEVALRYVAKLNLLLDASKVRTLPGPEHAAVSMMEDLGARLVVGVDSGQIWLEYRGQRYQ